MQIILCMISSPEFSRQGILVLSWTSFKYTLPWDYMEGGGGPEGTSICESGMEHFILLKKIILTYGHITGFGNMGNIF